MAFDQGIHFQAPKSGGGSVAASTRTSMLLDGDTKAEGSLEVLAVAVIRRGLIQSGIGLDGYRAAAKEFRAVGNARRCERGQCIGLVRAVALLVGAAAHCGHCLAVEFFGLDQVFDDESRFHCSSPKN